jgi:hypothetical protein
MLVKCDTACLHTEPQIINIFKALLCSMCVCMFPSMCVYVETGSLCPPGYVFQGLNLRHQAQDC